MASEEAIAIKRFNVIKRLDAAMKSLTAKRGMDYKRLPTTHKEGPALLGLAQLEHIAGVAEQLVGYEAINTPEFEAVEAIGSVTVPEDTAARLVGLAEVLASDAGVEWETVDFTDKATIDPLSHVEQQMTKALRAKGLIPEQEGEVTTRYEDADGNETDADGNLLPANTATDGDRDTEDAEPDAPVPTDAARTDVDVSDVVGNEGAVKRASRQAAQEATDPQSAARRPTPPRANTKKGS